MKSLLAKVRGNQQQQQNKQQQKEVKQETDYHCNQEGTSSTELTLPSVDHHNNSSGHVIHPLASSSSTPGQVEPSSRRPSTGSVTSISDRRRPSRPTSSSQFDIVSQSIVHSGPVPKAEMFIVRALEKILSDRDIKRSYNSQLRKCCEESLDCLKKELKEIESKQTSPASQVNHNDASSGSKPSNGSTTTATIESSALPSTKSSSIDAEKYFVPFELACSSKSPKIVTTGLDCIQKLIAYGHLKGNSPDPRNPSRLLIDCIVETICNCFQGPSTDDGVQLQIIKALLTLIPTPDVHVHESSILSTVKTCYNIYLGSKNLVNQTTAKATLQQMLNVIFARMETELDLIEQQQKSDNHSSSAVANGLVVNGSSRDSQASSGYKTSDLNQSINSNQSSSQSNCAISDTVSTSDTISVNTIEAPRSLTPVQSEAVDPVVVTLMNDVLDNVSNSVDRPPSRQSNKSKLNDGVILSPIHEQATLNPLMGVPTNLKDAAGRVNSSDSIDSSDSNITTSDGQDIIKSHTFLHVTQKDAYLVFRSLCKLSAKPLPDGLTDSKSHELRSKILSLQLILNILTNSGKNFQKTEIFSIAIKQYLCVSLSKNGVSPITEVFDLSLSIFLVLLTHFKVHLKMQIEVFFRDIFLNILETPRSPFDHKWMVIQSLNKICCNAQSVVDIYINYDCNLSSANIFERLVDDLSKIAQGKGCTLMDSGLITPIQERSMRISGLECLVSILNAMVTWTSDLFINPSSQTINLDNDDQDADSNQSNRINSTDHNTSSAGDNYVGTSTSDLDDPSKTNLGKELKTTIEEGIRLFNMKPKNGLKYLQDKKLLGTTSTDIASFFHHEERLNKTMIGEFMGENESFNKEVMYQYVDQMDFKGKDIVTALRSFLEGFRLPGEAQKIDRLMEKFASRYCETNPNNSIFASADTAYVLSYSIIMLTTDLHSPQVKNKMTKEQYIKMNRGINDSKDLPSEYLSDIYDEILSSEIKMKHTSSASLLTSSTSNRTSSSSAPKDEKTRKFIYNLEMEQIAKTARTLMESVAHAEAPYVTAKHCEHVKPMFKLAWTPFLAAFSVGLNDSEELEIINPCLKGFKHAIRIACVFRMETERNAYVQALARFTGLGPSNLTTTISEMKPKNVETIKTLIALANSDGNYLGSNWLDVLRCISQLELVQMVGTGSYKDVVTRSSSSSFASTFANSVTSTPMNGLANKMEILSIDALTGGSRKQADHHMSASTSNYSLSETSSQEVVVAVDRIFHKGSTLLDGDAVVHFVRSLCQVSNEELSMPCPRMFSLQRIVEFSFHNMTRIRLQWSRIWSILGDHFNGAGCSNNMDIAYFAIDSLRQLSMKFIEKGEFSNFRFQKDFLRPFEVIMTKTDIDDVRRFVVECITQMVNKQKDKIMSGWKNIFAVFQSAANNGNSDIVAYGFHTTTEIVSNHILLERNFIPMIDCFQDVVKCLSDFACNDGLQDIAMKSINLIGNCAECVRKHGHNIKMSSSYLFMSSNNNSSDDHTSPLPSSPTQQPTMMTNSNDEQQQQQLNENQSAIWFRGWFPILFELSRIISKANKDVGTRALSVMFQIIKNNGGSFKLEWWNDLFQVIYRIFDCLKNVNQDDEDDNNHYHYHDKTSPDGIFGLTLVSITEIFIQYYDNLSISLLSSFYDLLIVCINCKDESLILNAMGRLSDVIIANGSKFNEETWTLTVNRLITLNDATKPNELLTWIPPNITKSPMNAGRKGSLIVTTASAKDSPEIEKFFISIKRKSVIQLELVHVIDRIILGPGHSTAEDEELITDLQSELEMRTSRHRLLTKSSMASSVKSVDTRSVDNVSVSSKSVPMSASNDANGGSQEKSMFRFISTATLLQLKDAAMDSHEFAKQFNSNNDQRNVLWKANYQGNSKPNLMSQESQSLCLALRILFKLYQDESRRDDWNLVGNELKKICLSSLQYFLSLEVEQHREKWLPVLILLMSKLNTLPEEKFRLQASTLYPCLCDMLYNDSKPPIRAILRRVFVTIGSFYNISSSTPPQSLPS